MRLAEGRERKVVAVWSAASNVTRAEAGATTAGWICRRAKSDFALYNGTFRCQLLGISQRHRVIAGSNPVLLLGLVKVDTASPEPSPRSYPYTSTPLAIGRSPVDTELLEGVLLLRALEVRDLTPDLLQLRLQVLNLQVLMHERSDEHASDSRRDELRPRLARNFPHAKRERVPNERREEHCTDTEDENGYGGPVGLDARRTPGRQDEAGAEGRKGENEEGEDVTDVKRFGEDNLAALGRVATGAVGLDSSYGSGGGGGGSRPGGGRLVRVRRRVAASRGAG